MDKGILKNVSINFIGLILPTFVSLVTVPAYIHALGSNATASSASCGR